MIVCVWGGYYDRRIDDCDSKGTEREVVMGGERMGRMDVGIGGGD